MTVRAFVHSDGRYFEGIGDTVTPPAGFNAVPPRPGPRHVWNGARWIEGEQPPAPARDLSPARFEFLLAYTGLGDVWDALEQELRMVDRAAFASIRAQRRKSTYSLDATLQAVAAWREAAARHAAGVDLSETAIRAAWDMAARVPL